MRVGVAAKMGPMMETRVRREPQGGGLIMPEALWEPSIDAPGMLTLVSHWLCALVRRQWGACSSDLALLQVRGHLGGGVMHIWLPLRGQHGVPTQPGSELDSGRVASLLHATVYPLHNWAGPRLSSWT